ncbi:LAFE_0B11342g1_1 [Lachancea fermentati]|uniref:LAFE_0B11342g1_1 n=1 Tax=Lachancea fermentati TaxID=4955 RepID=A0A1G4M8L6_LACFM|nr:LAFE_0B11342g1_1 [Lachancea fermentati]
MVYDVVIIGGGVFGLSTAAQFIRSGQKVVVIDKYAIPSPISAANDYNKIVRLEYNDPVYAGMAVESMNYWQGNAGELLPRGLLHNTYSHCGRISVVPPETTARYKFELQSLELLKKQFGRCNDVSEYKGDLTCSGIFPQFSNARLPPTQLLRFNPDCGIGIAAKSLTRMKQYCEQNGVQFIEADGVTHVVGGDPVKVETASGRIIVARRALVACGANSSSLLPTGQLVKATGLYVGHIQLTEQEYEKYKGIPVVFNPALGYFFPPDEDTKTLKICACASSTYDKSSDGVRPRYKVEEPSIVRSIPRQSVTQIRTLISQYLPDLLEFNGKLREIIDCKICWISDTSNSDFVIDEVPHQPNVFVSCGDSGHGYKFLPNIGKYIKKRMDGTLASPLASKWKWREGAWGKTKLGWRMEHNRKHIDEIEWFESKLQSKL